MHQTKRLGRPRLDPTDARPSEPVNLTLPARDYELAAKIAAQRRESLQDVIRRGLRRELFRT